METKIKPKPEKYLDSIEKEKKVKILQELEKLSDSFLDHKSVKLMKIENEFLFRLKIENLEKNLNHRAIFDIEDGKIKILKIGHRNRIYYSGIP